MAGYDDILKALAGQQAAQFNQGPVSQFINAAGTEAGGKLGAAGQAIVQALMAPGNALRGQYDEREIRPDGSVSQFDPRMMDDATELAGAIGLSSMPVAKPAGSLGMFGGRSAKTADHAALERAQALESSGAPRDAIWSDTGWFKGADGQWRFEMDDSASAYNPAAMADKDYRFGSHSVMGREGAAQDVLSHPSIYEAYPDLANMPVAQTQYGSGAMGMYAEKGNYTPEMIGLEPSVIDGNARTVMLHELQHAIQQREGFGRGGSAKAMGDQHPNPKAAIYQGALMNYEPSLVRMQKLSKSAEYDAELAKSNDLWNKVYGPRIDAIEDRQVTRADFKKLEPEINAVFEEFRVVSEKDFPTMAEVEALQRELTERGIPLSQPSATLTPDQAYRSLAGEVEARNTETRMNMTPEQRKAQAPWLTQDVPDNQQIIRMLFGQ